MELKDIHELKKRFVTRQVGEEMVLVPVESNVADMNELLTMNSTACFIWNCIDGVKSEDDIVSMMVEEFSVDTDTARDDLNAFLDEMRNL